jgi:Tol biopolymer transport system component/DNA-binding winged helix-turn-helix (wHTH) protein
VRVKDTPAPGHRAFAFDAFVADTVTRRLWHDGHPVPISAKTFDVLIVLLEHRDRLVSKDELLDRVWPDTAVQENNLPRQVSSLRRALGQRGEQADYILTVQGQGYRFVADVQDLLELPPHLKEANGVHRSVGPDQEGNQDDMLPAGEASPAGPTLWGGDVDSADSAAAQTLAAKRLTLGRLAGAAVLLATLALVLTRGGREGPHPVTPPALQRLTYDSISQPGDASWSPDGQAIVFASDRAGNSDLWILRIGEPDPVRLTISDTGESQPQWSPDGRTIVFRSEQDGGGLYVMPAAGGPARMISSFGYEPRWSPDSNWILFTRSLILPGLPALYVVGLDAKPPQPVRPEVLGQFSALHAAWYPDGRRVSIWGTVDGSEMRFVHVPIDSGDITTSEIASAVRANLSGIETGRFTWARSRKHLYFEGRVGDTRNLWRMSADASGRLVDGPVRLTTGTGEETDLALSPDGTRALFTSSSTRTRLWAFPIEASTGRITGIPQPITNGSTDEVDFDARTDGSKVAYRAVRAGRNELWERSVQEGRERLLLSSPVWRLSRPRWSPDGAKLAFLRCGTREKTPVLAVVNADGSGQRALTRPEEVEMLVSDWSSDGQSILGSCRFGRSDRYATCAVPVSSESASPVIIASDPRRNLFSQRYSPDQRWITFLAHDLLYNATSTVYVIPAGGGGWRAMTDGATFDDKPRWGPDGRVLYYVSNRDGIRNVWGRRFDSANGTPLGEPFPVTSFRSPAFVMSPKTVQMDIAITATHLLIPMRESRSDIWMLDNVDRSDSPR